MTKQPSLRTLAKSNFILSELGKLRPDAFPMYLKYNLVHAFNGADLCIAPDPESLNSNIPESFAAINAEILFFNPQNDHDLDGSDSLIVKLNDLSVSIYPLNNQLFDFSDEKIVCSIEKAGNQFDQLGNSQSDHDQSQVRRIHFNVRAAMENKNIADQLMSNYFEKLCLSLNGTLVDEPAFQDWINPDISEEERNELYAEYIHEWEILLNVGNDLEKVVSKLNQASELVQFKIGDDIEDAFRSGLIASNEKFTLWVYFKQY